MRTSQQFSKVWQDLTWWLSFHKTPVWLVATEDNYSLSVIEPEPHELPAGTAANLYGVGFEIIKTVNSSK